MATSNTTYAQTSAPVAGSGWIAGVLVGATWALAMSAHAMAQFPAYAWLAKLLAATTVMTGVPSIAMCWTLARASLRRAQEQARWERA